MAVAFTVSSLLFIMLAVHWFHLASSAVQCNVGLKLYSVESGKVVCASLSHFTCVEACEWNTTCTLTSHYEAFRGRRTYVAGMILNNSTFLLQCCASLGTIVEMNERQEPTCTWSQLIDTVPDRGSVRFDPPLATNEYVRDMIMERRGTSGVVLRAQVCKFAKQRADCDRGPMAEEELRQYSILLLRLSRTKDLMKRGGSFSSSVTRSLMTKPITELKRDAEERPEDSFKTADEIHANHRTSPHNRLNSFHSLFEHTTPAANRLNQFRGAVRSRTPVTVGDSVVGSGLGDGRDIPVVDDETSRRVRKDQPTGAVAGATGRAARHPQGIRNFAEAGAASKSWPLALLNKSGMEVDESLDARKALQSPSARGFAHAPSRFVEAPYRVQISAREALANWPRGAAPKLRSPTSWANAGQTSFFEPSSPWPSLKKEWESSSPDSALAARESRKKGELLLEKSERASRKLHAGQTSTSFGGSFAMGPIATDTAAIEDPEGFEWGLSYSPRIGGNRDRFSAPTQLQQQQTTQLGKAPPFKIIPISRPFIRHHNLTSSSSHAEQNNFPLPAPTHHSIIANRDIDLGRSLMPLDRLLPVSINGNELESPNELAAMAGLLSCCEHQSPSCRQLCSRDVSKEQIKQAIISHQCPPLSMTSVIQCYARYFNITSVAECCTAQTQPGLPPQHHASALLSPEGRTAARLPQQCTALCAPNFKLSISHLACIDHISSIVDCYRELISKR